ncbi:MAG: hypothetical protein JSW69_01880 [Deltaproteobacteria bacterium]|jgi:hypothetical protein|nr:MAG: hypothetical protein JSW69_01880 [Deltaproteobacteria bacterium]
MDKIVNDLKKLVPFKETVEVGDIVLVAAKKPQMLVYGLVSDIIRDDTKRDEWWHVSMHILSLPPRKVTWILRTPQMTGQEIFSMDGEERFMKAVNFDKNSEPKKKDTEQGSKDKPSLRRIK